jgi:hypothetical protein
VGGETGAEAWGWQQDTACRAGTSPEAQQGMTVWAGDKQVVHIPGSDHCDIQLNAHSWRSVRKFLRSRLGH